MADSLALRRKRYTITVFDGIDKRIFDNATFCYNPQDGSFHITTRDGLGITFYGNYVASTVLEDYK